MIKPITHLLACAFACGYSASLLAAPGAATGYDYAGLQYTEQNLDDYDCNQDGLNAYASLALDGPWFVQGGLTDVSGNNGCGSNTITLGAGYHTLLTQSWDLYGTLSAERTDPDNSSSDTGLIAALGTRGWITKKTEGKVELAHHTVFDDRTELNLGAYYWLYPSIAGTLDTSFSDEGESIALGARFTF